MNLRYIPQSFFKGFDASINLQVFADMMRIQVLYMVHRAGGGHIGTCLSSAEIVTCVFCGITAKRSNGDIFFSSKGHDVALFYAVAVAHSEVGEWVMHDFRTSKVPGHPSRPMFFTNTGSLGMGLSKAQGMALAMRARGNPGRVYVLLGDGEMQEGQNYEAIRNIGRLQLPITAIVDANGQGCDGPIEADVGLCDYATSKGWAYYRNDHGNDCEAVNKSLSVKLPKDKPFLIYTGTKKSEGILSNFFPGGIELYEKGGHYRFHAGRMTQVEYDLTIDHLVSRINDRGIKVELANGTSREKFTAEESNDLTRHYSDILAKIMSEAPGVHALDADLAWDCGLWGIKGAYTDRFHEFGISEQDMVSAAGGMALNGLIPVVNSFAAFLCRRANEQIYNNSTEGTKIVYVGHLAGGLPPGPGASHECVGDVALMKTMPGMTVLCPTTREEVFQALTWAVYEAKGPTYIRLACRAGLERMRGS